MAHPAPSRSRPRRTRPTRGRPSAPATCGIACILGQLVLAVAQVVLPPNLAAVSGLVLLATGLAGTVLVLLLSARVYRSATGIVLGVLTLVPCVGLVALLVVNARATGVLRGHGVRVGLLGARRADLRRAVLPSATPGGTGGVRRGERRGGRPVRRGGGDR